jgi:4'-phosphopantetheinyl transferase
MTAPSTTVTRPSPSLQAERIWLAPSKVRDLLDNEVHVWLVNLDLEIYSLSRFLRDLSLSERTRAKKLRFESDQRRFVLAKGMLRHLLGDYLGMPPHEIQFSAGPAGKPELSQGHLGDTGFFHFNQSHSGHLAVFAFSRTHRVGVDIEEIRPYNELEQVAELLLNSKELAAFHNLTPEAKQEAFFGAWTCKEAFVKAIGKGLSLPLSSFEISGTANGLSRIVQSDQHPPQPLGWHVKQLPISTQFAAAVCAEGDEWTVHCLKW